MGLLVAMGKAGTEDLENPGSKWVGSEGQYCRACK